MFDTEETMTKQTPTEAPETVPEPKKTIVISGRPYEIVERYLDAKGQEYVVVDTPLFPDSRIGAAQPPAGATIQRHIPVPSKDSDKPQPLGRVALKV